MSEAPFAEQLQFRQDMIRWCVVLMWRLQFLLSLKLRQNMAHAELL